MLLGRKTTQKQKNRLWGFFSTTKNNADAHLNLMNT